MTSNGLAAGATRADASMRAAVELIERDAFMISWLARLPGRRIALDDSIDPGTREVARQIAERGARLELYLLDVGLAVPTILAVGFGDGRRWPGATVAMAAHLSPRAAIRKAVLEQGHVGPYLRRLMIEGNQIIPERPEDVRTLSDHAIYYFPPSRASAFAFLDAGEPTPAACLEGARGSVARRARRARPRRRPSRRGRRRDLTRSRGDSLPDRSGSGAGLPADSFRPRPRAARQSAPPGHGPSRDQPRPAPDGLKDRDEEKQRGRRREALSCALPP